MNEVAFLDLELTVTLVTQIIHDQKPKAGRELEEAKVFIMGGQKLSHRECKKKYEEIGLISTIKNENRGEEEEKIE
jgi:hypothetical protein